MTTVAWHWSLRSISTIHTTSSSLSAIPTQITDLWTVYQLHTIQSSSSTTIYSAPITSEL